MVKRWKVLLAVVAPLGCSIWAGSANAAVQLTKECMDAIGKAVVESAYKVDVEPPAPAARPSGQSPSAGGQSSPQPPQTAQPATQIPTVSLGEMIAVRITALAELKKECAQAPIVLFLNGYPIRTVRPYPPSAPGADSTSGEVRFVLRVSDGSTATDGTPLPPAFAGRQKAAEIWRPILGRPPWPWQDPRRVDVSVGLEDQYPLKAAPGKSLPLLQINVLGNRWFFIWGVTFLAMFGFFAWCVRTSNIVRNGNPAVVTANTSGTYSLSKAQGAFWFFVILAAYLLIGLVTGDYLDSINGTALILLGIGAGTVIGAAVIDKTKEDPAKIRTEIAETGAKLGQLKTDIAALKITLTGNPNDADAKNKLLDKESEKDVLLSNYRKLTGQSEGFWTDILSDANGVSFHRFQMAVFTVVLGIVFIRGVYDDLAMPEFNTTLMGLLGLSAGTYLGLKIPEATTPKKVS